MNPEPRTHGFSPRSAPLVAGWLRRLATAVERANVREYDLARKELVKLGLTITRNFDGNVAAG